MKAKGQRETSLEAAEREERWGQDRLSKPGVVAQSAAHTAWMEGYYYGLTKAMECEWPIEVAELADEASETLEGMR